CRHVRWNYSCEPGRTSLMRPFLPLFLLTMVAACGAAEDADRAAADRVSPVTAAPPAPRTEPDSAAADPVERWAARLPEGALRRHGACPFECCVYGSWTADSRI